MKFTLYAAQTVNGNIAGSGDRPISNKALWKSYYSIAKRFKAIVVGSRTYDIMLEHGTFGKIGRPFVVVCSRHRTAKSSGNVSFVRSVDEAADMLRRRGFGSALIGGGGGLNASFMRAGLVDELILDIDSSAFGEGTNLFSGTAFNARLSLIGVKKFSDEAVQLRYSVDSVRA
ncbi:MAG: dihydrofolate reductase family protein [Candidatus Micrarchaeota archaeon]|nr:dihydrofolate reductase family protein [Candidatus Micrarchaeota archaeon]